MAKMDSERPHRGGGGSSSSELFICFTSRPSSATSTSMMKSSGSSKSILSPGRTGDKYREPTLAFSSSMNRRLRTSGSIKGGQSPMFPTGNKKRGAGFENPEPSSPKVTCIGQVRVKTKKKKKTIRSRSRRSNGEVSFRKTEERCEDGILKQGNGRHQRWVQLPLTICEGLRAFGSEFNCFLPCGGRSSCARERGEKRRSGSCGAVFARWLMALQEGEEEKSRDIKIVVGEDEEKKRVGFGEIEEGKRVEVKGEEEEIEEGRVSVCIPPKNALLLMRCRSEPLRMSALANRFWDSPIRQDEDDEEEDESSGSTEDEESEEEDEEEDEKFEDVVVEEEEVKLDLDEAEHQPIEEISEKCVVSSDEVGEVEILGYKQIEEDPLKEEEELSIQNENLELVEEEELIIVENEASMESVEALQTPESGEHEVEEEEASIEERVVVEEEEEGPKIEAWVLIEEKKEHSSSSSRVSTCYNGEELELKLLSFEEELARAIAELIVKAALEEEKIEDTTQEIASSDVKDSSESEKSETNQQSQIKVKEEKSGGSSKLLPDCLLMMMCEPKLSMEVSKETWVSSTDFIRCRPEKKPVIKTNGGDSSNTRVTLNSNPVQQHENASMASMIEQKLVNAVAYEPFVLTRCKSEPIRSSAKLVPEACCWKGRQQIEPHRLRVGATAGLGF